MTSYHNLNQVECLKICLGFAQSNRKYSSILQSINFLVRFTLTGAEINYNINIIFTINVNYNML